MHFEPFWAILDHVSFQLLGGDVPKKHEGAILEHNLLRGAKKGHNFCVQPLTMKQSW